MYQHSVSNKCYNLAGTSTFSNKHHFMGINYFPYLWLFMNFFQTFAFYIHSKRNSRFEISINSQHYQVDEYLFFSWKLYLTYKYHKVFAITCATISSEWVLFETISCHLHVHVNITNNLPFFAEAQK